MCNEKEIPFVKLFKKNKSLIFILITCSFYSCNFSNRVNKDHPEYFDSVMNKAFRLDMISADLAIAYVDSVYNSFPDPGVGDLFKKYDYKGSYYSEVKKDRLKAMLYVDSSLFIIESMGLQNVYTEYYIKALFTKGDQLLDQKEYNNAINYYYKGKKIIESLHDSCIFYQYSRRLAFVSYRQADYPRAIYYYQKGFRELYYCDAENGFERFRNQQAHLDDIALCYEKYGKLDSALYYYNEALSYIMRHEAKFPQKKKFIEIARGVIYGNLGNTYFKKGDMKNAESFFKKGIAINSKKGHPNEDAQITKSKLIHLYLETSRINEAKILLQQLRVSLNNSPSETVEVRWYQLQSDYYYKLRRTDSAYHYLKKYLALKDSITINSIKLVGFNKEFEDFEHRYELELFKKETELKSIYLVIALLFSVMITAIVILVWINWKRSKNHVRLLTQLNEQIRMQNTEMQKALDSLEQSQKDNARMMKIVAHDLRNPIGATINIADILLKEYNYSEDQKNLLTLMKKSSQNSLELITDLLYIDTNPESMKMEPVDIVKLLRYCVELLQFKAAQKQQQLIFKTQVGELIIPLNREKMWRVISNIIGNAIKFSSENDVIEIEMYKKEKVVHILVRDNGIGIPEGLREKIFDMFSDAKRKGTANEQSFGLGLSIARQIIEAHHGRIWFESEQGKGTTFYVELPISL
jgi:signal transduction histidine kinase